MKYLGAGITEERIDAVPARLPAHRGQVIGFVLGNQHRGHARAARGCQEFRRVIAHQLVRFVHEPEHGPRIQFNVALLAGRLPQTR
jgi:hypothetical protein